jgi:exodeoxyribonuclease-3
MKLISWNVNGIRAVEKKGFFDFLEAENPDVLGVQEIKATADKLPKSITDVDGYHTYFNSAQRPGYSGTGLFTKTEPNEVNTQLGIPDFDNEGRLQEAHFGDFVFFNIYFPNGKSSPERLQYKLDFYDAALQHFNNLVAEGKKLLISGDYNTAHHPIDLARPKQNEDVSGFLPIERKWMDQLVDHGYSDCFRMFNKDPDHYSWWSYRSGARQRNVGWRIDYFFCSENIVDQIEDCYYLPKVMGSDHCPIVLKLK